MREGRKLALQLFDSEAEAEAFAGGDVQRYVEHRTAEWERCQVYCRFGARCGICTQFAGADDAVVPLA